MNQTAKDSRKTLTIGLLWHSGNSDNLGVGALAASQIAIIDALAERVGCSVRYLLLGWKDPRPSYIAHKQVESQGLRTRDLVNPFGGLLRQVRRCDAILDISAGDSFADIYGAKRCAKILASKLVVLASSRSLVLSPQTLGPFERGWVRKTALFILNRASLVCTRDELSRDFVQNLGYRGVVVRSTDVALRLPYSPRPRTDGAIKIGVNLSGLLFNGGYSGRNMFSLASDFASFGRALLAALAAVPNAEVHLVSHVISDTQAVEDDYRLAERLAGEFPDTVLAPKFGSPSDAKSYISGLDFFCGSRMHACIAAFSSGVPVVPLAYSRKFIGLFGALGYDQVVDLQREEEGSAVNAVLAALERRQALAAEVKISRREGLERLGLYEEALERIFEELLRKKR